jgi:DNA polymerase III epsilon subunit-like protein
MYLFFDTETTGLPRRNADYRTEFLAWPRLVELAWLLYDQDGNKLDEYHSIIKPVDYEIPAEVTKIHGISQERALQEGKSIKDALGGFLYALEYAEVLVAHNIAFDEGIIGSEYARLNSLPGKLETIKKYDTTQSGPYCGMPPGRRPRLGELYYCLFNEGFDDAHTAMADTEALRKIFFELKKKGLEI